MPNILCLFTSLHGHRNGFGMGGGGYISHLHIKRIQFCSLYICNFQNPLSYQSILASFIYTYLHVTILKLIFFWLTKYWGPPSSTPVPTDCALNSSVIYRDSRLPAISKGPNEHFFTAIRERDRQTDRQTDSFN